MTRGRQGESAPPPGTPGHPQRDQTDSSLRAERDRAEERYAERRGAAEDQADESTRVSREQADDRTDHVRSEADREQKEDPPGPERSEQKSQRTRERHRSDRVLETERSDADAVLHKERLTQRTHLADLLTVERTSTDTDLHGERHHADSITTDLREANQQMVNATIRAHELAEEADAAKARAEASERELREVAEFREMFIGILGHDLRNPLNAINIATGSMLRRGRLDEQDARAAARIIRSAQRMTQMITQLLDLTRTRLGGGMPLEPRQVDLRALCRDVVEEFEAPIQLHVDEDVNGVWDPDRLAEALSNLVGNAVQYATPGTTPAVRVSGEGPDVILEVRNEGPTIPADVLPTLFEPFRRSQGRRKSPEGNLGLGLYIARQIVLAHGGTLAGSSEEGLTTFTIRIPRAGPPPQNG